MVQPAQLMVVRRLSWIADRAVATIVASIELMNSPTATIAKIRWRDGPGPGVDGAASRPAECSIATVVSLSNDPLVAAPGAQSVPQRLHVPAERAVGDAGGQVFGEGVQFGPQSGGRQDRVRTADGKAAGLMHGEEFAREHLGNAIECGPARLSRFKRECLGVFLPARRLNRPDDRRDRLTTKLVRYADRPFGRDVETLRSRLLNGG